MATLSNPKRRLRVTRGGLGVLLSVALLGGAWLWQHSKWPIALSYSTVASSFSDDISIMVDCQHPEKMLIRFFQKHPIPVDPTSGDLRPGSNERTHAVFEFDRQTSTLVEVDDDLWIQARGERCARSTCFLPVLGLKISSKHELLLKGRKVATAGRTVLGYEVSTDGRYAAVLSATGRPRSSWMPFIGGPKWAGGTHFHELFEFPSMKRLGTPVRLPLASRRSQILILWAPCSAYVLYTDLNYRKLCVIPVESKGDAAGEKQ